MAGWSMGNIANNKKIFLRPCALSYFQSFQCSSNSCLQFRNGDVLYFPQCTSRLYNTQWDLLTDVKVRGMSLTLRKSLCFSLISRGKEQRDSLDRQTRMIPQIHPKEKHFTVHSPSRDLPCQCWWKCHLQHS